MTILEINNYFSIRGGSETALFETVEALEGRGHCVVPFAMRHPKNVPNEYDAYFPNPAPRWQFWKRLYNRDVARALERLIVDVKPDVAHLHNIAYQLTPAVIAVLRRRGIPMVQTLHDYQAVSALPLLYSRGEIFETNHWGSALRIVFQRAYKGALVASVAAVVHTMIDRLFGFTRSVHRFLAPSLFVANMATRYGLPEEHVVFLPQSQEVHDACRDSDPRSYFLFFGRLSDEKGVGELIERWAHVSKEQTLLVVGAGPAEAALRRLARARGIENIRWFGACENREMLHRIIERARAVLVPSQWYENAPYTVLEAFAHATPVIASDIGGLPELVDETRGWLVDPESVVGWTAAIRAVAEHPEEARRRGETARQWLLNTRSRVDYGSELESVLYKAIACVGSPEWCAAQLV